MKSLNKNSTQVINYIRSHPEDQIMTIKSNKGWYDISHVDQPMFIDDEGTEYQFASGQCDNIIDRLIDKKFRFNIWMTKSQVNQRGYKIKKGQKPLTQKIRLKKAGTSKLFQLYNIDQTTLNSPKIRTYNHSERNQAIDAWIDSLEINIAFNGFSPAFWGDNDTIVFPHWEQFKNGHQYYSTLFHEIGHWTGWKKRLERISLLDQADNRDPLYGYEEAIAEMIAIKLCEYWDIPVDIDQHIRYISSWLDFIEDSEEKLYICHSANKMADQAIEFLFNMEKR